MTVWKYYQPCQHKQFKMIFFPFYCHLHIFTSRYNIIKMIKMKW